jgi:KaiC/GvpD/RAD55 family RecA-like ATPase
MATRMNTSTESVPATDSTGIAGLDEVLRGGLTADRVYLVEGVPGSGKTTLALQFLLEGARRGERVLYVTLSETRAELQGIARSHGWSLEGLDIRELVPSEASLRPDDQYTMFHPSEIELSETTKAILADVDRLVPRRVAFDSLSEMRLLAGNPLRYRRQLLALKQFFAGRNCTVVLLDDLTSTNHDLQVQSVVHGVIRLEQLNPEYGAERRRLVVLKFRGVPMRGGYHDYVIKKGGLVVFPRLATLRRRSQGLGVPLEKHLDEGNVTVQQIDPAELSPGEFAHRIMHCVEYHRARVVVIDSLNGYLSGMPEERFLIVQLHEMLAYLGQAGVATILVSAHQGLIGSAMQAPVDASYLADSVILMRYFEARGEVRQAISVMKKRGGRHERTVREFRLSSDGVYVGEPLREFRGVLTGVPVAEQPPPRGVG